MGGKKKKGNAFRVKEDLTVAHAGNFREQFAGLLAGDGPILLDFSKVGEMDTAGFQLLAALKRDADEAGREFRITAHSQATLSMLRLYNMEAYFGLDDDALGILGSEGNEDESEPGGGNPLRRRPE